VTDLAETDLRRDDEPILSDGRLDDTAGRARAGGGAGVSGAAIGGPCGNATFSGVVSPPRIVITVE
jgi:hypothetical protein